MRLNTHSRTSPTSILCGPTVRAVALALLAGTASASAQTLLIDFETMTAMPNAQGTAVPVASRVADQFLATHHVRFFSNSPYIAAVSLGLNHASSGTKGIGGVSATGALSYAVANPIQGRFLGADGETPHVTTFVSARGDRIAAGGNKTLRVYGIDGTLLGEAIRPDSDTMPIRVDAPNIHRFEIIGNTLSNIAFDDVSFNQPTPCPTFSRQPAAAQVCAGATVTFRAALSTPTLSEFRWRRNGVPLDPAINPSASTPTLILTDVQTAHAGAYDCVISSVCGPLPSAPAELVVTSGGYGNCDNSTNPPTLNALDFICFLQRYNAALTLSPTSQTSSYANCDASTNPPTLNSLDFICFLQRYRAGCP